MPTLLDRLSTGLLLRQLLKSVDRLGDQLVEQNKILLRLVEKVAPEIPQEPVSKGSRSVDYSQDREQAKILEYIERTQRDVGREPTEEEVVAYITGRTLDVES